MRSRLFWWRRFLLNVVILLILVRESIAAASPGSSWTPLVGSKHPTPKKTETSSTKPDNRVKPTYNSNPTLVSGYGSRNHRHASSVKIVKTIVTITNEGQQVEQEVEALRTSAPLFVQQSNNNTIQLFVGKEQRNVEFEIQSNGSLGMKVVPDNRSEADLSRQWIPVESIFGVYEVPLGRLMVFVVDSESFYEDPLYIRRVKELHAVLLPNPNVMASSALTREMERQLQLLRAAWKEHDWYFSVSTDMTVSLQARTVGSIASPDSRFYWNEAMLEPLLHHTNATILRDYSHSMVSAFCGVIRHDDFVELLISRRNKNRAGTRFTKRGADTTGAVANAVETEQILITNSSIASFVQTRGSLPLFWSSPTDIKTYRPRVRIGVDPIAQARAVLAHIQDHTMRYVTTPTNQSILMVNLIDKHSDQGRLGKAFDSVLSAVKDVFALKHIEHLWFDFHAEVKSGRWHRLLGLLEQATPALKAHGYFCRNGNSVTKQQDGVIRTNCMDCLDRTNVVQSMFGRYILFQTLMESGLVADANVISSYETNPLTLPNANWEKAHRELWADNADAISRLYAGTPALKGDFTRTGKRTKKGALEDGVNSLQRYYQNNFLDADRQEGIDLLTGLTQFHGVDEAPTVIATPRQILKEKDGANLPEMGIRDAALKLFSGDFEPERLLESNIEFKRIKIPEDESRKQKTLALRWLPADLKSHVRHLASSNGDRLEALDNRSSTSAPWWISTDSSDDEDAGKNPSATNLALMFGALVFGSQSPLSMATVVLSIMATSLVRSGENASPVSEAEQGGL